MSLSRYTLFLALACSALLGGCGLGDDGPPPIAIQPDAGAPRQDTLLGPVARPSVDPVSSPACSESIAIQGTTTPGLTVFAVGGLATSGVAKDAHPTTGRFCLDVPLQLGVENRIEVRAKDPARGMSDPVLVSVTQKTDCNTDPPAPPEPPPSKNVARGVAPVSNVVPSENTSLSNLTDGNDSTFVVLAQPSWMPWGDAQIWLSLQLGQLTDVDRVVVKWRDPSAAGKNTYFASKYKLLISDEADPGIPDVTTGHWSVAAVVTSGLGGNEEHTISATGIRHVALWLTEDGTYVAAYEYFIPAEIEVWNTPEKVGPGQPTQPNTCAAAQN